MLYAYNTPSTPPPPLFALCVAAKRHNKKIVEKILNADPRHQDLLLSAEVTKDEVMPLLPIEHALKDIASINQANHDLYYRRKALLAIAFDAFNYLASQTCAVAMSALSDGAHLETKIDSIFRLLTIEHEWFKPYKANLETAYEAYTQSAACSAASSPEVSYTRRKTV